MVDSDTIRRLGLTFRFFNTIQNIHQSAQVAGKDIHQAGDRRVQGADQLTE